MIVVVTGDRDWSDAQLIERVLSRLGQDTVLIHGDARGADLLAGVYGLRRGWEVHPEPAQWYKYRKAAGPIRNQLMLDKWHPEVCHAFHDDLEHSTGTKDMVQRCLKGGVPVFVHTHLNEHPGESMAESHGQQSTFQDLGF